MDSFGTWSVSGRPLCDELYITLDVVVSAWEQSPEAAGSSGTGRREGTADWCCSLVVDSLTCLLIPYACGVGVSVTDHLPSLFLVFYCHIQQLVYKKWEDFYIFTRSGFNFELNFLQAKIPGSTQHITFFVLFCCELWVIGAGGSPVVRAPAPAPQSSGPQMRNRWGTEQECCVLTSNTAADRKLPEDWRHTLHVHIL